MAPTHSLPHEIDRGHTDELLDRLDRLFAAHQWPGAPDLAGVRMLARRRALATLDLPQSTHKDEQAAPLRFAAELLAALGIEVAADPGRAAELIAKVEQEASLSRPALTREVLRTPSLLGFPPAVAIEVQLGLMLAFAPLERVSVWMLRADGGVQCVSHAGSEVASPEIDELARDLLTRTNTQTGGRAGMIGVTVERWERRAAALIARPQAGREARAAAVLEEVAPMLSAILEREDLINRHHEAAQGLAQAHERRLTRLGFDIHDGPLQDLALIGQDIHALRRQLGEKLDEPIRLDAIARLDDLAAQLVNTDSALRRISASLRSPFMTDQDIGEAVEYMIEALRVRTGVAAAVDVDGDLEDLTDSQHLALLSIIREALNNIRDHSQAANVTVRVAGRPTSIEAQIVDDGIGFDVEETVVRAARDGRFGLVGMHERARLLGGITEIESRPGGPTTLSLTLPRWRPVGVDQQD